MNQPHKYTIKSQITAMEKTLGEGLMSISRRHTSTGQSQLEHLYFPTTNLFAVLTGSWCCLSVGCVPHIRGNYSGWKSHFLTGKWSQPCRNGMTKLLVSWHELRREEEKYNEWGGQTSVSHSVGGWQCPEGKEKLSSFKCLPEELLRGLKG